MENHEQLNDFYVIHYLKERDIWHVLACHQLTKKLCLLKMKMKKMALSFELKADAKKA